MMENRDWISINTIPSIRKGRLSIFKIELQNLELSKLDVSNIPSLSIAEIQRIAKFRFTIDKLRFGISRMAVRRICAKHLEVLPSELEMDFNKYGKPAIEDGGSLKFNISHSGDLLLIGVSLDQEIGVDVEVYNHEIDHLELARSVFSEMEQADLQKASAYQQIVGFYNCWSLKESFIKAMGLGLQIPLNQFSVNMFTADEANSLMRVDYNKQLEEEWRSTNLFIKNDYAAAYTCHSTVNEIQSFDLTEFIARELESISLLKTLKV